MLTPNPHGLGTPSEVLGVALIIINIKNKTFVFIIIIIIINNYATGPLAFLRMILHVLLHVLTPPGYIHIIICM